MKKFIAILLLVASLTLVFASCDLSSYLNFGNKETLERGETTDSEYVNKSLGFTYTLPEGWRFYSDEEIAALMKISSSMFKDENLYESSKVTTIFEFMAVETRTSSSVSFCVENLSVTNNTKLDEEEYIGILKDTIKTQFTGGTYSFGETTKVALGDTDFYKLEATGKVSSMNINQYIYVRKVGNYMACITVTDTTGKVASDFEAMFTK